jgi:hypothetical protein
MKWLLLVISLNLLTNCAVQPPNVPLFIELGQHIVKDPITGDILLKPSPTCYEKIHELECLYGIYTMDGKEVFVGNNPINYFNGKSADQIKEESLLAPSIETYAPIATYIINSCKALNCSSDVTKFKVKIDSLKGALK